MLNYVLKGAIKMILDKIHAKADKRNYKLHRGLELNLPFIQKTIYYIKKSDAFNSYELINMIKITD